MDYVHIFSSRRGKGSGFACVDGVRGAASLLGKQPKLDK